MDKIVLILVSLLLVLVSSEPEVLQVDESDIKLYFSSKDDPSNEILLNISDASEVAKTAFSTNKDTVFYIHGWMDKDSSGSCQLIKNSYLPRYDVNMFIVDWSSLADNILYPIAFGHVESIGTVLGNLIKNLVQNSQLDLNATTIVGHSLGAHVAGVAGAFLAAQVDHVVGLDPAGPLFTKENTANRLTTSSAKFVQAIHTCGGLLGYFDQIGHADYYPNGGSHQPNCGLDLGGKCSHLRALDYFTESILTGNFKAKKCGNFDDYQKGECNNGEVSNMGEYNVDKKADGTYFLETNGETPYAKN